MEKKILTLLKKDFPKFRVPKNLNYKKIYLKDIKGWDSLSSINFFLKLQKATKKKINIVKIINCKTIYDVIKSLDKK